MWVGWKESGPYIEADLETNSLNVRGTPGQLHGVREVVALLDGLRSEQPIDPAKKEIQPKKAGPPKAPAPPVGEPLLQIHPVSGGNAEAIAKLLQEIFPAPKTRIVALGPNQIAVWADPQTQIELARQRPLAPGVTVVIPLDQMNPAKTASTLKGMFGEPKSGGPFIEADTSSNSLRIRGSAEQVDEIKQVLQKLRTQVAGPRNVRTITVEEGSATALAEALAELFPAIRANPLTVMTPAKPRSDPPKKTPPSENKDGKQGKGSAPLIIDASGKGLPHVTIFTLGNSLQIISADPESLDVIEQMVRIFLSTDTGSDFELIRLKKIKAADAARIIDEAFNLPVTKKGKGERSRAHSRCRRHRQQFDPAACSTA